MGQGRGVTPDCDACPLRGGTRVPSQLREAPLMTIVGDFPGEEDEKRGQPFLGTAGATLDALLAGFGVYRDQISYVNVLSCRPDNGRLDRVLKGIGDENKERRKKKLPLAPTPMECCKPRFDAEVTGDFLVPLGRLATQAVLGSDVTITDARGNPIERGGLRILPAYHPSFVLRKPSERFAFEADIGRAVRWAKTGTTGWVSPLLVHQPSLARIREWWRGVQGKSVTFDIETLKWPGRPDNRYDSLTDVLAMIGVYHERAGGLVIQLISNDGQTRLYGDEERAVRVQLAQILTEPTTPKLSWNGGYYDRIVLERELGVVPNPHLDGILVHRAVQSELSHKLGYVGSIWTDAPAWKSAHAKRDVETDEEWRDYNGIDLAVTDRTIAQIRERARERDQSVALRVHHTVQRMCVGLHQMGMLVDEKKRAQLDAEQRVIAVANLKAIRQAVGDPAFNPQSVAQLRKLLFETWDLPVQKGHRTKTGDPSTDDDAIRALATGIRGGKVGTLVATKEQVLATIDGLRRFRKATKLRGTYLQKLIPWDRQIIKDDLSDDAEDPEIVAADGENEAVKARVRERLAASKRFGIVDPRDGRIHADYNAHGPATQRISSSNPNCFDAATEILTTVGWLPFPQLTQAHCVAQWHPDGSVDFTQPTDVIAQRASEMIALKNTHIDLRLTPDHRCLLRHRRTGELRVFAAEDYREDWRQIHAGTYGGGRGINMTCGEIRLMVAFQADGAWADSRSGLDFGVSKARKIERLESLFAACRLPYRKAERITSSAYVQDCAVSRYMVGCSDFGDRLRGLVGQKKVFGAWVFDMTREQIDAFVDELFFWDGCPSRDSMYSTSLEVNADLAQALLALSGRRVNKRMYMAASGRPNYQIDHTCRDSSLTTNIEKTREDVDELVYCVSVPSSYVIVRRNGKVCVTGQCQNFPRSIRSVCMPGLGRRFVYADADQLELRFAAALWDLRAYVLAFNTPGVDPHNLSAELIFGDVYKKAEGDEKSRLRDFAKRFTYACVPMDTQALTRTGWKTYPQLKVGEEILVYDPKLNGKRWAPIQHLTYKPKSDIWEMSHGHSFNVRASSDHRWLVRKRKWLGGRWESRPYMRELVETTAEINTESNIVRNGPMLDARPAETWAAERSDLLISEKYQHNWERAVCQMSSEERRAFLAGFLIADGHSGGRDEKTWVWSQLEGPLAEAALAATAIEHNGSLYTTRLTHNANPMLCTILSKRSHTTGQKLVKRQLKNQPVWCPTVETGFWVMRQGYCVTVTGNCLYGAESATIHEVITSAEDGKGGLPFAWVTLAQVEEAYEKWTGNIPQITAGWDAMQAEYARGGFLREPVLGFRRDFLNAGGDKDIKNEILNFSCQAGGAALIHLAAAKLIDGPLPFDIDRRLGMVNQSHDAMTFEVECLCTPEQKLDKKGKPYWAHESSCPCTRAASDLEAAMRQRPISVVTTGSLVKGREFPISFGASAKIVDTWC